MAPAVMSENQQIRFHASLTLVAAISDMLDMPTRRNSGSILFTTFCAVIILTTAHGQRHFEPVAMR